MNIIKVSDSIYKTYPKHRGHESKIYEQDGILLKIFNTSNIEILKNKREKLEIISSLDIDDAKPIDLIEINNVIKGYTMLDDGYKVLDIYKQRNRKKIETLKIIKNKLNILHQNNIIFGDLNPGNILTNGIKIHFCDLDNVKIGNLNFDALNVCQKRYLFNLDPDEYLDNYIFNLLAITY